MLYADDTILYTSGNDALDIQTRLQSYLDITVQWTQLNKLTINSSKTKIMLFNRSTAPQKHQLHLSVNQVPLQRVGDYKYLGFRLDERLDLKLLLNEVIMSVQHKVYLLNKVRSSITSKTALLILKCKILPYLDYADILYNEVDKTQIKKLQTLQNRCIRIAFKLKRTTNVDNKHVALKMLHVENRRTLHLLTYMHSISSDSDLLDRRSLPTRSHNGPTFTPIRPNTVWFKKSFLYQGVTLWNKLPCSYRNTTDTDRFKSMLKRKLLDEEKILYPLP